MTKLRSSLASLCIAFLASGTGSAGASSPPAISAVYPSAAEIPQRLLRLSMLFAAPPDGPVLPALSLRRDDGEAIQGAFLQQELWAPDRRTLTLLLDPGRVKTGLIAHDTHGPVLKAGESVSLFLGGVAVHRWAVAQGGCVPPEPSAWQIDAPPAASRAALRVSFKGAIDAQSRTLIAVTDAAGAGIAGNAALQDAERQWRFVPAALWPRGRMRLIIHPRLETPCGDEIGDSFEHADGAGLGSRRTALIRWFSID